LWRRKWTKEEILVLISKKLPKGVKPITVKDLKELGIPYNVIRELWGGLNDLNKFLGREVSKFHRRLTDIELLKFLLEISKDIKRTPKQKDIIEYSKKTRLKYSPLSTIKRRFGSVEKAHWLAIGCNRCIKKVKELQNIVPSNEEELKALFWKIADEFGFELVETRKFPDAIFILHGKRYKMCKVEFEYKSEDFIKHRHDPQQIDMLICWEHNWKECPVEVFELKKIIEYIREMAKTTQY